MQGRIVKIVSNQYTVQNEQGNRLVCICMGKVRLEGKPVVGDLVEYEIYDGQGSIEKILPRHNTMVRPAIANVDQAIIVMSAADPAFSTTLVDFLTFLVCHAHIEPLLCITKMDLIEEGSLDPIIEAYRKIGMKVFLCRKNELNEDFAEQLKGRITVLTGQSGVGKSSLLNRLNPDFRLQTQETSKALGRGKHTTRHSELHEVAGGLVADTPGFSKLDFSRMSIDELKESVREFRNIPECRFRDCIHVNEPDCEIKKAVDEGKIPSFRYEHYVEIVKEIQNRKVKY